MTFRAQVKDGVIVLDEPATLHEGTKLVILVKRPTEAVVESDKPTGTLYETMKPFIGCANDLPPDMSVNLDHYLYGAPKRE